MIPIVNRFSFKYFKAKIESYITGIIHPDWPWWPKDAVDICNQLLRAEDIVIEYGSGRSTIWLAKRCNSLTSVEHNHNWYMSVRGQISSYNISNIDLIYAPLGETVTKNEELYLEPLTRLEAESIDIVIIDGKRRALTALNSISKLKHGGVLIIDDSHRYFPERSNGKIPNILDKEIWESVFNLIKDWRSLRTSDGLHATDFYFKP